jgi:hypothetical protein
MAITSSYSPEIFTLVPMCQLSKRHFDLHPIWSEFYDYEEREEIVSWGVDQKWLEQELEKFHTGNDHCAYPILRPYPLPERMRLYIKARFATASGTYLEGCVMNDDAFVVTLFVGDDNHTFSRHPAFADWYDASLRSLQKAIGGSDDAIFPLNYETDFLGANDAPIAGIFSPSAAP